MRPLMDLVRQRAEPAEGEAEHRGRRAPCAIEWNRVQHQEDGNRDRRDLSVGINEAAAEEIIGVDVMHAERNQQARADDWAIVAAPGVGGPVNQPRSKVRRGESGGERQRHPPMPGVKPRRDAPSEQSEQTAGSGNRAGREGDLSASQLVMDGQC